MKRGAPARIQKERADFAAYIATISEAALEGVARSKDAEGRRDLADVARAELRRRIDARSK